MVTEVDAGEDARLATVRRYDILDTPPDGAFDRVTRLAARICAVPISTISIVDTDRIWFKSAHGIEIDQIGRDPGLCASAVIQDSTWVVNDAAVDPRTLDNPLVRGELGLRFYVGVPLKVGSGHNLGVLNVIDVEPRQLTEEQLDDLRDLAAIVVDELELRLNARTSVTEEAVREAARFRDAIVAGVSHEMRTPLAVLRSCSLLLGEQDDPSDPEVGELRALERRQIEHLDWLVRQFLDYTSLEDEQPPTLDIGRVDLEPVVRSASEVFVGRETPIEIEVGDGPLHAEVDTDRTRQIVIELLNNAIRFGGTRPIQVRIDGAGDEVRVAVEDHGGGIAPEFLDRVFDKAYRGASSTGTGLGLYLARTFAEAQGGRLDVTSEPGAGSTFTLALPRSTS